MVYTLLLIHGYVLFAAEWGTALQNATFPLYHATVAMLA